jgi:hypothetical protein
MPTRKEQNAWDVGKRKGGIAHRQMVITMHSTNAEPANFPRRSVADGLVADIRSDSRTDIGLNGAVAYAADTTKADTGIRVGAGADAAFVDAVVSRVPYPTLDQVAESVAIQRLQWLRHLPAPRTTAENRVFQRIRTLGWSAPDETGRDRNEAHS